MAYLGIDIGGTRIKAGLVDREGKILERRAIATPTESSEFSGKLRKLIAELIENAQIDGAGIGCKGIVNPATTEVEICPGTFRFLEKKRLSDLVAGVLKTSVSVFADNDARAMLVGERLWGAARGKQNALLFTLGTGLGGAILADGVILRGASGVAGHLGHATIEPDGAICICGNRGCLETVFSARAIEAAAIDAVHRGCESVLNEKSAGNLQNLTCLDVFEAAQTGDLVAQTIVGDAIAKLGAGIAGLLHVFDSEIVIVGGQIAEAGAPLFEPLKNEIRWRTKRFLNREVPLLLPEIDDTSGIVGAAALAVI